MSVSQNSSGEFFLRHAFGCITGPCLTSLVSRISRLELLDEVEELNLVLKHYAIAWGAKTFLPAEKSSLWEQWGLKIPPQTSLHG